MEINEVCRIQKFSVIIDESTDVSVTQVLAIVIRYFDHKKRDVVDALLDTVTVDNGSAAGLFDAFKSVLEKRNIPLNNIIGFGSDNCSTMLGKSNGFQKLLKDVLPIVFVLGCVCHSFALCASHAVSVLPPFLESLLKDITSYFSRSSKRQNDFAIIKDVVKVVHHRIPKLAQTRWLSRENVISVILEQWDALVLYFQANSKTDLVDGAHKIYEHFINRGTKHMLCFLQYVLRKVNALNLEFQLEHFRLHLLHTMVSSEYKSILSLYIKEEVLMNTALCDIDPSDKKLFNPLEDLFLGGRTMSLLEQEPLVNDVLARFKNDCLKFLVTLCVQIKQRFSFDENSIVARLKILDPKLISTESAPASIAKLASSFPNLIPDDKLNDLDDEYRSFRLTRDLHDIDH